MNEVEFWTKQLEMARGYGLTAGYELSKLKKAKAEAAEEAKIRLVSDQNLKSIASEIARF